MQHIEHVCVCYCPARTLSICGKLHKQLLSLLPPRGEWAEQGDLTAVRLDACILYHAIQYSCKEKEHVNHINYLFWVNLVIEFQDIKNTVLDPL